MTAEQNLLQSLANDDDIDVDEECSEVGDLF